MSRAGQVDRDERFQSFMDWARHGSVPTLLFHVERLMKGLGDPLYGQIDPIMETLAESDGWSTVIELIAQVQKEHEAAVRG